MQPDISAEPGKGTYPVLRRLVRMDSIRIGSLGEILLNKLWPTTVVGGVVGDLDEDESNDKLMGPLAQ